MALTSKSLFLYNLTVDDTNQVIPFLNVNAGSEIDAVIPIGTYSLAQLATAIAAAMNLADTSNTYTVSVDRTASSGTENRITIATSGSFLSLLFSSGSEAGNSCRDLIAFGHTDFTGATTYTNSGTTGTALITTEVGYNYLGPEMNKQNWGGAVNISTDGTKETLTWSIQSFIDVEFRYETQANVIMYWEPLLVWMMEQKAFDFTPNIASPSIFYPVTLEKSSADGKGLAFKMKELLPDFPFMFSTGPMTFRVIGQG